GPLGQLDQLPGVGFAVLVDPGVFRLEAAGDGREGTSAALAPEVDLDLEALAPIEERFSPFVLKRGPEAAHRLPRASIRLGPGDHILVDLDNRHHAEETAGGRLGASIVQNAVADIAAHASHATGR